MRLAGRSATLADIAFEACADDIFPGSHSATAAGDDVVEAEHVCRQASSAILAAVSVACQHGIAIEADVFSGHSFVKEQSNYARHLYLEIDRADPVVVR